MPTYQGGCHCGAVRYEVTKAEAPTSPIDCNCSVCTKKGILHLGAEHDEFKITQGQATLKLYQFNTATAKHWFCGNCGIHVYGVPRSNPERLSVNARTLDSFHALLPSVTLTPFDGINHPKDRQA